MAENDMNQYLLVGNRKAENWQVAQNVFINDKGRQREIRYCQNESSIFVDEQNPKSKTTHIWITKGNIRVNKNDTVQNRFLQMHPHNPTKFFMYDVDAEANKELALIEIEQEARELFDDLDFEQREAVATVLFGATTITRWGEGKAKVELYKILRNNPAKMSKIIKDPATELIYLASTAIRLGIIQTTPDKTSVVWADTQHEIIPIPKGRNPLTEMSRFLKTIDGLTTLQDLGQRIKDKAPKTPVKKRARAKAK